MLMFLVKFPQSYFAHSDIPTGVKTEPHKAKVLLRGLRNLFKILEVVN